MFLQSVRVENYDKDGNKIEPKEIILKYPLIYSLLKKYLKALNLKSQSLNIPTILDAM